MILLNSTPGIRGPERVGPVRRSLFHSKNELTNIFRVFHIEKSTEKRWVYKIEGYTCSEPIFVKNPQLGTDDDEGVVLTVMTPIYDDLR